MFIHEFCKLASAALTTIFLAQSNENSKQNIKTRLSPEIFEEAYSWSLNNFTWPSVSAYQEALSSQRYVPENNGFSGIKYYRDRLYVSLPRNSAGAPVTLASIPIASPKFGALLEPYPSWDMNVMESCSTLQNVQSMEIDTNGVMWVLDGNRFVPGLTNCPPKIVLLDMKNNGKLLQTFVVPSDLTPYQGGWLNDLVIDESDGGFAYISEASNQDPGIIVYSRQQNTGWKFRDSTFFAETEASGFSLKGIAINNLMNVNGIALSPLLKSSNNRLLYYNSLTGYSLYALSTNILKNESLSITSNWRNNIQYIGRKTSVGDGMVIDNQGQLYFGLLPEYGIAKWNTNNQPFEKYVKTIYQNYATVDWADSLGFDDKGNLYLTADQSERILNTSVQAPSSDGVRFRILKLYTGTNSYLYP